MLVSILITVAALATILMTWEIFKKEKFKDLLKTIADTMADGKIDDAEKILLISKLVAIFKK